MQPVVIDLVKRLAEIQDSRSHWEPDLDVHCNDLAGRVTELMDTAPTDFASVEAIIQDPGYSFRAIADTLVTAACWVCLYEGAESRQSLCHTFAPWGGLVTLLANISRRYLSRFKSTGNVRCVRYALAAITLLGDNADPRDDLLFLGRVHQALMEHGLDPPVIFQEFMNSSAGQAHKLFAKACTDPSFSLHSVLGRR